MRIAKKAEKVFVDLPIRFGGSFARRSMCRCRGLISEQCSLRSTTDRSHRGWILAQTLVSCKVKEAYLHNSLRHPFHSETRPRQGMRIKGIIKEGRVLLPNLILLHDFLLLDIIGILNYTENETKIKNFFAKSSNIANKVQANGAEEVGPTLLLERIVYHRNSVLGLAASILSFRLFLLDSLVLVMYLLYYCTLCLNL